MKATTTIRSFKKNVKTIKEAFAERNIKFYKGSDRKKLQTLLRDRGFHSTEGRLKMLSVLGAAEGPLSVLEITKRCDGWLDEVNVYRAIQAFVGTGMVRLVDLQKGHAEQYELNNDHHHHIVCTSCGTAKDFETCMIEKLSDTVLKQVRGFAVVNSHSFELFGTCNSCVSK